ncbi:retron St85 family effector protein [Pseudomonas aeruginosa]
MDIRTKIIEDLDTSSAKVERSSKPIVLLCGGHVPEKKSDKDDEPPIKSLRHKLTKHSITQPLSYEIFRPEEIDDWSRDGVFSNLMDFEADLAHICSLIAIILESEGSFAELGAFSQLPGLKRRTVAIISNEFSEKDSFINLGILRHLRNENPTGVKKFPWETKHPHTTKDETLNDILEDLKDDLEGLRKSEQFDTNNPAHLTVAIHEMTNLLVALKESEILEHLKEIGLTTTKESLRRKLFLLEKFGLVKKISYSDSSFYASTRKPFHQIRFGLKSKDPFNPIRLRLEALKYYEETKKERNRFRAIRDAKIGAER